MRRIGIGFVVLAALGVALLDPGAARAGKRAPRGQIEVWERGEGRPVDPGELEIVDCLLPGQVRKLGRQTFLTARRPVRTTSKDCAIRGGEQVLYDRTDLDTALGVWMELAEQGDTQAQYYVAQIYEQDRGAGPDHAKAAEWYRRAAERGHGPSQVTLGYLYEKGLGVERDLDQARRWYLEGAGSQSVVMLEAEMREREEEMVALRSELAGANQRLERAEGAASRLGEELETARRELETARGSAQLSRERESELVTKISRLAGELDQRQAEVRLLAQNRARLELPGPTISVFDTRERSVRETPARLAGRVEAPAGLVRFEINDRAVAVDERGFFDLDAGGATRFEMVATDRAGKRGELVHELRRASRPPDLATKVDFGDYHALVIGNSNYLEYPDLTTAAADAVALSELLKERYGFSVKLMTDANYLAILGELNGLMKRLGEKDNLLIYFAGHGELDSATQEGYWLPVDAKQGSSRTYWLSAQQIRERLEQIPAKHVLVVADSCYSGWLTASSVPRFNGADEKERRRFFETVLPQRSRIGLTSGGLRPVLDAGGGAHSIFAQALIDILATNADVLDTRTLSASIKDRVEYEMKRLNREQTPEWAPIDGAGHAMGDFFFVPVGA